MRRLPCLALLAAGLLGACEDAVEPGADFSITPGTAEVVVGDAVQFTALNAPGEVDWSSSSETVATVVRETGYVSAIGRGQATISAVSDGTVATASVEVLLQPALALSAATIGFEVTLGAPDPPPQTVTVTNAGDRVLAGVAPGAIVYGEGQPTGWLTVTANGSTAPVTLTLAARRGTLPRGTYTAIVPVTANVENSPQNVAVMFAVQTPASIVASAAVVPLAGIPGSTVTGSVEITNGGDRPLTGLTTTITSQSSWLQASLSTTTAPATLDLTANTAGLAVGTYNGNVRVASAVAGTTPVDVGVTLTVAPGPAIALSRTTVAFQVSPGTTQTQTIEVTNSGGGTLTGIGLGAPQYGAGQAGGWLTTSINTTTSPATITVQVQSGTLAQGTYSATFAVQSAVASNSPLTVTVTLIVGPPPVIALNPTTVLFLAWKGSSTLPNLQGVQVTNAVTGPLTGLSFSVAYGPGATGWLDLSFQNNNTSAPTTILVRPNTIATLATGDYTATITVASSATGVASKTFNVIYQVRSYTLHVYPLIINAGCSGCHSEYSGSAATVYSNMGVYIVPGNPTASTLYCKVSGACGHVGGTYPSILNNLRNWIQAGAPRDF